MRENGKDFMHRAWESSRSSCLFFVALALSALLVFHAAARAQDDSKVRPTASTYPATTPPARTYPKEIRGYKVERAKVDIRKSSDSDKDEEEGVAPDSDALIRFGEPRVVRTTPLGITLEVPVTIAAVKQGGRVDFMAFEDMVVNGMPVEIEDYIHPFELPNKEPQKLPRPVRLFISSARALSGALGEFTNPKETWPVTGRVYVFGHFKKFFLSFKRVVPVELSLSLPNPLRSNKQSEQKISNPAIKQ